MTRQREYTGIMFSSKKCFGAIGIVRKAVEELPTQMRNIILYSMKGLKNHEIADKLQISEGTVHTLKKIAYRKLRENLKGISYTLLLFLCK